MATGVRFGKPEILKEVSLVVAAGECVAVVGPNGAGKSTLLRVLAGLEAPGEGSVEIDGRGIDGFDLKTAGRLRSYMPPDLGPSSDFTVAQVIEMGRHPWSVQASDDSIVGTSMSAVGVDGLSHRKFSTLSSGEARLVQIARTLAQDARFLLVDEPTAGLDLGRDHDVMKVLTTRAMLGAGVVAVVHNLNDVPRFFSRVLLLDHGEVVAAGVPTEVLTSPRLSMLYHRPITVLPSPIDGLPMIMPTP